MSLSEGVGDGKSAADVLIVGEEKAQHHNEDGKRVSEGVNDAPAATQAKTTTLSTEQHSFVSKFNPAPAKIDKERKISTRNVKGRFNSLKKQGVCDEIYIYMYPLLPRRARCVCVLWI